MSLQVIKTFKQSNAPDFEAKKNRVLELYDIADGNAKPKRGDPTVVFCMDEFGPLDLPAPSGQAVGASGRREGQHRVSTPAAAPGDVHSPARGPSSARAAYDLSRDRLYGHVKVRKDRTEFLAFCRYLRSLYPTEVRKPSSPRCATSLSTAPTTPPTGPRPP